MQAVCDIRIERVCRIPVPVRYAHHEDPEVTTAREYDNLTEDFLKLPRALSPVDPKDVYQMAYHIRSYSRWLGRYHSFARMLQLDGEYEIPSEADSPVPDWNNAEVDRIAKNGPIAYYDSYACISIMRDGSIVTHDGYGSSVVMSNGNVQISAARHIDIEAAGDIRMLAGGSILMKARRNIELSAALGGLVLHSYAWLKMLCEKGSVWLRSNAVTDKAAAPEPKEAGAPTPEIAGWESGETDGFAVLVEAADGSAAYRSKKGVTVAVDGKPSDTSDTAFDISVITGGDLLLRGKRKAALQSNQAVSISTQQLAISSPTILSNASEVIVGPTTGNPALVLRGTKLWCDTVESMALSSNRIQGPERGPQEVRPDPDPSRSVKKHFNHIDKLLAPIATPTGGDTAERAVMAEALKLVSKDPDLPWGEPSEGPEWAFPPKEEYAWDDREKAVGAIPETLTQQYLRLDAVTSGDDRWGGLGYADWEIREKIIGTRTNAASGFGYYDLQYQADDSGESLHAPSPTAPADMPEIETSWRPRDKFTIKYLKREGE